MSKNWVERKHPRVSCQQLAVATGASPSDYIVENISQGGCFIRSKREFEVGEIYEFSIKSEHLEEGLVVKGKVLWKAEEDFDDEDGGEQGYGVMFMDDDSEEVSTLIEAIQFLESLAAKR